MKKILFITLIASVTAFSTLQAQKHDKSTPRIEGSGNVITRDVAVQSFDELSASGIFNVLLTQGNKEQVKIEADDNLQDLFEVKTEGSKLIIRMKKDSNINTKKTLKVYVTFRTLKNMELKMVGNVSSAENLSFQDLKIKNSSVGSVDLRMTANTVNVDNESVGNVKLNGKADNAVIKNNGVGSIQAAGFVVQKMDIDNNGVGHAEVNAEKELKVKDSFLGKVSNKGNAPMKKSSKTVI